MSEKDPFELDIVDLINTHMSRHGLTEEHTQALLTELDESAKEIGIEPDSLYMILLDSISGNFVGTKEDILHQIKVLLNNSNVLRCFPV